MSDPELMSNDPDVGANVATTYTLPDPETGGTDDEAVFVLFPELTAREALVAEALIRGLKNREIAAEISISSKTVDTHRGHALKKLKVRNNVELVLLAFSRGWRP